MEKPCPKKKKKRKEKGRKEEEEKEEGAERDWESCRDRDSSG